MHIYIYAILTFIFSTSQLTVRQKNITIEKQKITAADNVKYNSRKTLGVSSSYSSPYISTDHCRSGVQHFQGLQKSP